MAYYANYRSLTDEELVSVEYGHDGYVASIIEGDSIQDIENRGMHLYSSYERFDTLEAAEKSLKELGYNYNIITK